MQSRCAKSNLTSFWQISSAACILCEFSAGTVQVGLFFLPLIGRLRLMVFCAIFSLLLTSLMIFLDISHIALMFPFNWPKLVSCLFDSCGVDSSESYVRLFPECVSVFHHKCNFYRRLVPTYPHGIFRARIYVGAAAFERHAFLIGGKYARRQVQYATDCESICARQRHFFLFVVGRCSATLAQPRRLSYRSWVSVLHDDIVKCRPMNVIA